MCTVFSTSVVPNAPPDNVQALTRSSTAILVTWDTVPEIDRNGIIIQYQVEFNQSTFNEVSSSSLTTTDGSQLMVELEELEEYVDYSVRVRAYTSVGPGPFSVAEVNTTQEDGELIACNHYTSVDFWPFWPQTEVSSNLVPSPPPSFSYCK